MRLVTGHNLVEPKPADAPLDFAFTAGDAELLAKCDAAVQALRTKHAAKAVEDELEAMGVKFVGGAA